MCIRDRKYTEYQQEQANLPKNIQERRQKELQELINEKWIYPPIHKKPYPYR